mgnify:CR=1 FL=1
MSEKNQISNLPVPSIGGLSVYLTQIKKLPYQPFPHVAQSKLLLLQNVLNF